MRSLFGVFVAFLAVGLIAGCANIPETDPPPERVGPTVGCTQNITVTTWIMDWQLRVSAGPIQSGTPFSATLDGVAVAHEEILDAAQLAFPDGVRELNLVELKATVHVRSGATGPDVVLFPDPNLYEYQCERTRTACDPANDELDDPPAAPGLRGNFDCEPVSAANPCGRFIPVPTSEDCEPGGICAGLGKTDQCDANEFCSTGGAAVELQEKTQQYTADVQAEKVLFGWDDQNTAIREGGLNDGTWILPTLYKEGDFLEAYEKPTGPVSLRLTTRGIPAAFECTMGVDSQDPVLGVDSFDSLSSPTPNSELISFPIQAEAL